MAPLSAFFVVTILAAQACCIPTTGKDRRQASLPSFVNTYGEQFYVLLGINVIAEYSF